MHLALPTLRSLDLIICALQLVLSMWCAKRFNGRVQRGSTRRVEACLHPMHCAWHRNSCVW